MNQQQLIKVNIKLNQEKSKLYKMSFVKNGKIQAIKENITLCQKDILGNNAKQTKDKTKFKNELVKNGI